MWQEVANKMVSMQGNRFGNDGVNDQLLVLMTWVTLKGPREEFSDSTKAQIRSSSVICKVWDKRKKAGPLFKYH